MIKMLRQLKKRGFTLIELLVVIAIIAILAAVLTPTVTDALTRGKMTGTLANGRSIFQALFAKDIEDPIFQTGGAYPRSTGTGRIFTDSTDFFRHVLTSGVMRVNTSFFSAPGVPPPATTNLTDFLGANNAWCISANLTDSSIDTTPLLFTRNLNVNQLSSGTFDYSAAMTENAPFGRKGLPTVLKGGSGLVFKPDTLNANFFSGGTNVTVLRPGAGL